MKASFTLGPAIDKAINIVAIIAVSAWVMYPTITVKAGNGLQNSGEQALVFEVKNLLASNTASSQNTDQNLLKTNNTPSGLSYRELLSANADIIAKDAYKEQLRNYLAQRRSPFVDCVDLLVELPTADKILSLANAESGMGLRAPRGKHNYWGVGGSNLWKMGNNVCEGIQSMDNFLHEFPRRSAVKYKDMSIVDMCGLYKQPCPGKASHHWVGNNTKVLNHLQYLKDQSRRIAQAKIEAGNLHIAIADLELK